MLQFCRLQASPITECISISSLYVPPYKIVQIFLVTGIRIRIKLWLRRTLVLLIQYAAMPKLSGMRYFIYVQ